MGTIGSGLLGSRDFEVSGMDTSDSGCRCIKFDFRQDLRLRGPSSLGLTLGKGSVSGSSPFHLLKGEK